MLAAPTTAAETASTVADESTPAELIDRWVGPPRTLDSLATGTGAAFVEITDGYLVLYTGIADNPKVFDSTLLAESSATVRLELSADDGDCHAGDVGHYRWTLSPAATTLTLTAVDDACQARADALVGNWTHTACNDHGRDCLGAVEPGSYSTNRFNPFGEFTYGQLTYTLPDGWAVAYDPQAAFFLRLASDYNGMVDTFYGVSTWADVAAAAQDCSDQRDPTVELGSAHIADWMESLPALTTTRRTIDLNGRSAEMVVVEIAADAETCDGFVSLVASRTSTPDPFNFGVYGTQHMRVILVDVADQRTVAIFLDDAVQDRFDELAESAMPIIESFTFSANPPTN